MNAELAALLRAAKETPGDEMPRLVIADWLDEHGEPARAELLRTQCHPVSHWRAGEALRARADALIAEHGRRWWGPDIGGSVTAQRGLIAVNATLDRLIRDDFSPALRDAWQQGWVNALHVADIRRRWPLLAECPLLVGVTELSFHDDSFSDVDAVLLARSPNLGTLTTLTAETSLLTPTGELALLRSPNLPRLTWLEASRNGLSLAKAIRHGNASGVLRLDGIHPSPAMLRLALDLTVRPIVEVRANHRGLARSLGDLLALPGLQRLHLTSRDLGRRAALTIAESAPPTLTHLDLDGTIVDADGVIALARSPALAGLQLFDVRDARLSANAVNVLCRAETFPAMRHIVLSGRKLSPEPRQRLRSRYGTALTLMHEAEGALEDT